MALHKDLTGADLHVPGAHKTQHEDGGADEINVAGLSGELADDQPPKAHSAAKITSGTVDTARLGSGTADATTYLRGDQTWATVAAGYTDEQAQDAVGAMVDSTLVYTDATPLLSRAALTGDVTASAGSNATTLANTAVTPGSYTSADITVDSKGRVTAAANGAGGGGGGGLVLLEQHAASASASLDFASWYSSTYDEYKLEILNLVPVTNAVFIFLRFSTNGGSSYDSATNYSWVDWRWVVGGQATGGGTAQTQIAIDGGGGGNSLSNSAAWGLCGSYTIYSPGSTSSYKRIVGATSHLIASGLSRQSANIAGAYETTTAANAFQIFASSGNLSTGIVRIYGIVK